jgi:hypothetical protein
LSTSTVGAISRSQQLLAANVTKTADSGTGQVYFVTSTGNMLMMF